MRASFLIEAALDSAVVETRVPPDCSVSGQALIAPNEDRQVRDGTKSDAYDDDQTLIAGAGVVRCEQRRLLGAACLRVRIILNGRTASRLVAVRGLVRTTGDPLKGHAIACRTLEEW